MLNLYRRHQPPCKFSTRRYRNCTCPIWVQGSLRGEYIRRGTEQAERPLRDDMHDAADHYKQEIKEMGEHLKQAAKRATERAKEAYQEARANKGST